MKETIYHSPVFKECAEMPHNPQSEELVFNCYTREIVNQIAALMSSQNINRTELAERLGTSNAFVSKVLRPDSNLTCKTLTKLVSALDGEIETRIVRKKFRPS